MANLIICSCLKARLRDEEIMGQLMQIQENEGLMLWILIKVRGKKTTYHVIHNECHVSCTLLLLLLQVLVP